MNVVFLTASAEVSPRFEHQLHLRGAMHDQTSCHQPTLAFGGGL
eukprot:CAMPEP_0115505214 /NCGR_PEP_ID=MMETSP0271-20121206/70439_1 /TAXON_ID=71861 /ORGANISM="Scrippsiella trochoidea, Strain CCMP3099" /LENGTH=43 /DNA_ID= /DNA_START= /DNA_END= /DNA_ORIENTATION=